MPTVVAPMRAVTGPVPSDGEHWAFEVKWDGIRAIAFVTDGVLRLQSSNLVDITQRWPEMAGVAGELGGRDAVVDGEIVTFDEHGVPDFGLLQTRMHVGTARQAAERAALQPAVLVAFDLLWFDGHDATGLGYEQRRQLLEGLVDPGPNWQVPPYYRGDGNELLAAVADKGMEGLMAKRLGSSYEIGRRSANWRKLKIRPRQELVVGGFTEGEGGRRGTLGALVLGYYGADGRLTYAGRVGSGMSDEDVRWWDRELRAAVAERCPFDPPPRGIHGRAAVWVEPRFVVEVAFANWSRDGRLRHPSYVGARFDKNPLDVRREA